MADESKQAVETPYSFELKEGHVFSGVRDANGHGELHSINDEPCVVYKDGTKWWYDHGKVHRDGDKPAVIWHNGVQEWFQMGRRHRANGPAVVYPNTQGVNAEFRGKNQYWLNGVLTRNEVVPPGVKL